MAKARLGRAQRLMKREAFSLLKAGQRAIIEANLSVPLPRKPMPAYRADGKRVCMGYMPTDFASRATHALIKPQSIRNDPKGVIKGKPRLGLDLANEYSFIGERVYDKAMKKPDKPKSAKAAKAGPVKQVFKKENT